MRQNLDCCEFIKEEENTQKLHQLLQELKKDQGTSFTFYLPALAEVSQHEEPANISKQAETIDPAARVLIMDDDSFIRSVLREMLGMMNCEVVATENGFDAVSLYRKKIMRVTNNLTLLFWT